MVLSASQQVVVLFTVVLFTFVVLPRMFGVGIGSSTKESRGFDPRFHRKAGPGPGAMRGQPISMNDPRSAQTAENMQQMKLMMEQEMKSDKYKPNSNKGYVFTLMPLYAIGVGVFAAYKFLKIKSADDTQTQRNKVVKGAKKSAEAESQLNELEQRLAQTERMLNSILTQLDPLTNCVKSVAQEQKNEIMSQLQTIRHLMKKRGMDCPPLNIEEPSCERNLDELIESLEVHENLVAGTSVVAEKNCSQGSQKTDHQHLDLKEENTNPPNAEVEGEQIPAEHHREAEEMEKEDAHGDDDEEGEESDEGDLTPLLEESVEFNIEDIGASQLGPEEQPGSGLRRRNRPE